MNKERALFRHICTDFPIKINCAAKSAAPVGKFDKKGEHSRFSPKFPQEKYFIIER